MCRHSIHLDDKQSGELKAAANSFPFPIEDSEHLYHCGYHSEHSFGAASYLLRRPEGNVMMDSSRFDKTLLKNIQVCSTHGVALKQQTCLDAYQNVN